MTRAECTDDCQCGRHKPLARLGQEMTCEECKQTFTAYAAKARFCSKACWRANYNRVDQDKIRARKARYAARRRERTRAAREARPPAEPRPRPKCEPDCQCARHTKVVLMRRELTCIECGKAFVASRSDAKYCSPECQTARYTRENKDKINATHRAWNEAHPEVVAESKRRNEEKYGDRYRETKRQRYEDGREDPEVREARQEYQRVYYEENAERLRTYARERSRKKRETDPMYGRRAAHGTPLGPLFDAMWEAQDGKCYLCGDTLQRDVKRAIHLDHDHSCCGPERTCEKCRRGLACKECNLVIGWAKDDPDRLRRIADNLEVAAAAARQRMSA